MHSTPLPVPAAARRARIGAALLLGSAALAAWVLVPRGPAPAQAQEGSAEPVPSWIWAPGGAKPNQRVFFRAAFDLDGRAQSARFAGSCDNIMTVYVNGRKILHSENWETPTAADAAPALRRGRNVIAIEARNDGGTVAGLLARLRIEAGRRPPRSIVTDASWRTSAEAPEGWLEPDFDDSGWTPAAKLAELGAPPWTSVNARSLDAATNPRPVVADAADKLKVAKGFKVELLYTVPKETQGSWVNMTIDPEGRLIVSDQYGKLHRVTPPAIGADPSTIAVEPIPVEIGSAHGLLHAFGALYVMVGENAFQGPGLYRVRDTDGDDRYDKVELLRNLKGSGEHGPHAVILAPDGRSLLVACGNHTDPTEFDASRLPRNWGEDQLLTRMWDAGGHAVGRMAPGGWIAKVDPDGQSWELISAGYRNQFDIALNREGEVFTYDSDMEWDMNTPWYRPTRVCHAVSGSEFGWRSGTGKWPAYYPDSLPATVNVGPGSPTGVVFGHGAKFPAKYQEALFICDWSYGKLYATHLRPEGSTYVGELEEFVTGTPLPLTDVVIHPRDGAMYFTIGGRRTSSGLYRVTYVGDESTAPSPGPVDTAEAKALRDLRRSIEAFHGKADPAAVEAVWPHLGHADRFIRYAARVALEFQDVDSWVLRAQREENPRASLSALLALTRVGRPEHRAIVLEGLERLDWGSLSEAERLEGLRVLGLAFIRLGAPDAELAAEVAEALDPAFPAETVDLNRELGRLMVYLKAPSAASKLLKLMAEAPTQEEQMDYAFMLRELDGPWTMDQRREYFAWFLKAANYKGGNSFAGFVRNCKNEAMAKLTDEEREALRDVLEAKPIPPSELAPPRPFVRKWTLAELTPTLEEGLRGGRDFDRGRRLFAAANCYGCHRYGNEGGSTGPDLTGVAGRFTPADLLESLIDPSKTISDQYEAIQIETDDGRIVTGRIVNLNNDAIMINTDMLNPNAMTSVDRKSILETRASPVSMMPEGLLDTLDRDEIHDLMAYLLSRGDRSHPMFAK